MARHKKALELPIAADLEYVAKSTAEYMLGEGFKRVRYKGGEYYTKKGNIFYGPQYIRCSIMPGEMNIEAFIKIPLLLTSIGEMGVTGEFCSEMKIGLAASINKLIMHVNNHHFHQLHLNDYFDEN